MSHLPTSRLQARGLSVAHGPHPVLHALDLALPDGAFTAIIGPNGCGKSTLLHALARLRRPQGGQVLLDGAQIQRRPTREVARTLGLLPQSAEAPEGIRVRELVARGRHPHRGWLQPWSTADDQAVEQALTQTDLTPFAERPVDTLSGGQRQRAWLALALAQQTPLLLLDEPTTYLDLAHQVSLLRLLQDLQRRSGRTLVAVLHDLNQACRYADHLVVMQAGRVVEQGPPARVMTAGLLRRVFGLDCLVSRDPVTGGPWIVPL